MTRRPAVTLMEVLIAMFIMAIGMMALLALFPVGAVSMAQALKDDRCAYASLMAENVAIATNVRYGDANVQTALNASPSGLVYVDPYGVQGALGPLGSVIPRVAPSFATTTQLTDRWFSLPDDITFNQSGTADTSNTGVGITPPIIDRGRRYSWAYLLRRLQPTNLVQLYAVVYSGRPVNSLATTPGEWLYTAGTSGLPTPLGADQTNFLTLPAGITAKRGGWVLCNSINPSNGQFQGYYFYRVTNLVEVSTITTVELQTNLKGNVTQAIVMDYVAEVFDKGTGWQQ